MGSCLSRRWQLGQGPNVVRLPDTFDVLQAGPVTTLALHIEVRILLDRVVSHWRPARRIAVAREVAEKPGRCGGWLIEGRPVRYTISSEHAATVNVHVVRHSTWTMEYRLSRMVLRGSMRRALRFEPTRHGHTSIEDFSTSRIFPDILGMRPDR
jgi:hypothetical protein